MSFTVKISLSDARKVCVLLQAQRWEIPTYLLPVDQNRRQPSVPLHANPQGVQLGVLLRRRRCSASAPSGLDRAHLREELHDQQRFQAHLQARAEPEGGSGELLRSPAFQQARRHADDFTWGSVHRRQGRELAATLRDMPTYDRVYERLYDQVPLIGEWDCNLVERFFCLL